ERWDAGMQDLLGVRPANAAEGALQDIHWSMGAFGYFPSYTLGNIYAAQLFEAFTKEHPDWEERIKQGDFEFIKQWHFNQVHRHGRRYTSIELVEKITGAKVSAVPYITYLTKKYKTIFKK